MSINCVIIDDEPLAAEVIETHVNKLASLNIVAICHRATDAFEILRKQKVDLLFLDIQMPGLTGIEFLRSLKHPPKVILTTAYKDYALEGYELDIVDYLMKPISFERFVRAVNKFFEMQPQTIEVHHPEKEGSDAYVYVKAGKMINKVLLKDILYIESFKDYVNIHTSNRVITARQTLVSIEQSLPESLFVRIHRSYIVSINQITGFTSTTISINEKAIPIGRNYKQQVFHCLNYLPPEE
ncbi:LytR/AlgR family response regulator transcription factor [Carboxylicivirga sp. N1Y90]|uniref:LytR/AlgR family response regulator transcription factor n=1 Tax=Carboxylicivirga fragile TaxID=3417571 RepID=UPI003D33C27D|nr:response regulator transcription factor [Marinilabiliaceae bacterium N1Y90]